MMMLGFHHVPLQPWYKIESSVLLMPLVMFQCRRPIIPICIFFCHHCDSWLMAMNVITLIIVTSQIKLTQNCHCISISFATWYLSHSKIYYVWYQYLWKLFTCSDILQLMSGPLSMLWIPPTNSTWPHNPIKVFAELKQVNLVLCSAHFESHRWDIYISRLHWWLLNIVYAWICICVLDQTVRSAFAFAIQQFGLLRSSSLKYIHAMFELLRECPAFLLLQRSRWIMGSM